MMQYVPLNLPPQPQLVLKSYTQRAEDSDFKRKYSCEDFYYTKDKTVAVNSAPCLEELIGNIKQMNDNRGSLATISLLRNQTTQASGTISNYTSGTISL
ncbi:MAG: hypothetical protein WA152_03265 [Microgenomates group bacterium]